MYEVAVMGARRGVSLGLAFAGRSDCRVVAVCDAVPERLTAALIHFPGAHGYQDYADMLAGGADVVVVASPLPLHHDHSLAALAAGAHVLQEVPLARTVAECRDLVAAVDDHPDQRFMLAENCNYWGHVLAWARMFARGRLGEFMYGEAEYVHDVRSLLRDADGRPTWRAALPPIHYCTHSLGPLLKITGQTCVTACGLSSGSKLSPELGSIDTEVGIFQTSNGGVIKALMGFGVVREPSFHYYSLYGTRGCLETARPPTRLRSHAYLEDVPNTQGMIAMPMDYDVPGAPATAHTGGHGTAEHYMVDDFVRSIREGTPPPVDIRAAWAMSVPGLCAHESALRGGEPVAIPTPD
ncbi:MAG: Gfo/Idh/MocA family protein [Anaerolineae bacterium]